MKRILVALIFCLFVQNGWAQFDPLTNPLVYHSPGMEKVAAQRGIVYKTIHQDTLLKFDIYYPPGFDKKKNLPVVIFHNGVGGNQVPDWKLYQDWAKLVAENGMITITHQSRFRKTQKDLEYLLEYLRGNAELKVDRENMAIWVCSANTPTGWATANDPKNNFIKAIAIYYGVTRPQERVVKRKNLEILVARAGLDSDNINSGLEEFIANALRVDAHLEFINYPTGQHAFDGVDDTPRSKEIILQTVDFFKRNLLGDNSDAKSDLITNRQFWHQVLNENKTDEALARFKAAYDVYSKKPGQFILFNQLLNENNLIGLGYQLIATGRTEDAIKILTVNTEFFSNSPNAFDALSDAYQKKGDKANTLLNAELAIEKLEKATNLPPTFAKGIRESAQTKINEIKNPAPENIPSKRGHHELVYDEANKSIIMTAGSTPLNGGQSFKFFNDVWRYTNSGWNKTGTAGDERSGVRLAYDSKRKKIYSYGGFKGRNSEGELRVLEGNEWKILSDVPEMKATESGLFMIPNEINSLHLEVRDKVA